VKPKSKDTGTQAHGKFIFKCHNCGKVGHIRPNCFLLKTRISWIKQDAPKKGKVEKSSSSKYVPPHRRHIKGKDNVLCQIAEQVKKHFNKQRQPTCHHCGVTGHIRSHCHKIRHQSLGSRSKSQSQVSLALNLPSLIMLLGKSCNTLKEVLPHAVIMARMATPRPNSSKRSLRSPRRFRPMIACQHDEKCPSQTNQFGHGSQPYHTGKEGMGKEG
jgi:hypothetical protein